jgi:hypothetical protein
MTLGRGLRDATVGSTSSRVRRFFSLAVPLSPARPKYVSGSLGAGRAS